MGQNVLFPTGQQGAFESIGQQGLVLQHFIGLGTPGQQVGARQAPGHGRQLGKQQFFTSQRLGGQHLSAQQGPQQVQGAIQEGWTHLGGKQGKVWHLLGQQGRHGGQGGGHFRGQQGGWQEDGGGQTG